MKPVPTITEGILLAALGLALGFMVYVKFIRGKQQQPADNANQIMRSLTPDLVIARCGRPLKGPPVTSTSIGEERVLVYSDPALRQIVLIFTPADNVYQISMNVQGYGAAQRVSDPAAQIALLPCLANGTAYEYRLNLKH